MFEQSALENVHLPSTLKRIEYNVFDECKQLKNIQLPEGLEYIGRQCFYKSGLESIVLPATVKSVGSGAF